MNPSFLKKKIINMTISIMNPYDSCFCLNKDEISLGSRRDVTFFSFLRKDIHAALQSTKTLLIVFNCVNSIYGSFTEKATLFSREEYLCEYDVNEICSPSHSVHCINFRLFGGARVLFQYLWHENLQI